MFQDGEIVERMPGQTRGKDLIFLKADLLTLKPVKAGNPNIASLREKRKTVKNSLKTP
jgi:hypothetical protein